MKYKANRPPKSTITRTEIINKITKTKAIIRYAAEDRSWLIALKKIFSALIWSVICLSNECVKWTALLVIFKYIYKVGRVGQQ